VTERGGFFADAWRACLLAHFEHVVREGDLQNEASLRKVLNMVGIDDAYLDSLIERIVPGRLAAAQTEANNVAAEPEAPRQAEPVIVAEGEAGDRAADASAPEPAPEALPTAKPQPIRYAQVDLFAALEADPPPASEPPPPPPKSKKAAPKPKQMSFLDESG